MRQIILASASARRRELLQRMGISYRVIPSDVEEPLRTDIVPPRYAISLAQKKARHVAAACAAGLIIGSDTIVVYRGVIFGKPRDTEDAVRILKTLSGTTHEVFTAIAVINARTGHELVDIDRTVVHTRRLRNSVLRRLAEKNLDKAGAYAVQEDHDVLVRSLEGAFDTVVGLPTDKLRNLLRLMGYRC